MKPRVGSLFSTVATLYLFAAVVRYSIAQTDPPATPSFAPTPASSLTQTAPPAAHEPESSTRQSDRDRRRGPGRPPHRRPGGGGELVHEKRPHSMIAYRGGYVVWSGSLTSVKELVHPYLRRAVLSMRPYGIVNGFYLREDRPILTFLKEHRGVRVDENGEFEMDERRTREDAVWALERISRGKSRHLGRGNNRHGFAYDYFPSLQGQHTLLYTLDSGINTAHSEFAQGRAHVLAQLTFVPGLRETELQAYPEDPTGHGTAVAGCALGATIGVAGQAEAFAVRVADADESATLDSILRGLQGVRDHASTRFEGVPVVVVFAGHGGHYEVLERAFASMMAHQSLIVTASGNDAVDACEYMPAAIAGVVVLSGSNMVDSFVPASGYGWCVSLIAPSVGVEVPMRRSADGYRIGSGTSLAAGFAAGVLLTALSEGSPMRDVMTSSERAERWLMQTAERDAIHRLPPNTNNLLLRTIRREE
ncbi:hypothetical protein PYCC9005_004128 [Savitreella phatthalungensis]